MSKNVKKVESVVQVSLFSALKLLTIINIILKQFMFG